MYCCCLKANLDSVTSLPWLEGQKEKQVQQEARKLLSSPTSLHIAFFALDLLSYKVQTYSESRK